MYIFEVGIVFVIVIETVTLLQIYRPDHITRETTPLDTHPLTLIQRENFVQFGSQIEKTESINLLKQTLVIIYVTNGPYQADSP